MDTVENLKLLTFAVRIGISFLGCSIFYYSYRYWINGERYIKSAESPDNKVAIVTGASKGIGKEVAYGLAKRGLHVVMACHDMENGLRAKNEIIQKTGNQNVKCMYLNLASFKSIRSFAKDFLNTGSRLDILINNANVLRFKRQTTEDDIEQNIGINYFGHYLLTMLLIERLAQATPSRIINVSNWLHRCVEIVPTDLMNERHFSGFISYARSTLANVYFTLALTQRIQNTGVTCNCVHPGMQLTQFLERQNFSQKCLVSKRLAIFLSKILYKNLDACADTIIFAAIDFSCQNISGIYLSNAEIGDFGANSKNEKITEWLWNKSEEITGEKLCELPNNFKFKYYYK